MLWKNHEKAMEFLFWGSVQTLRVIIPSGRLTRFRTNKIYYTSVGKLIPVQCTPNHTG